ncbi:MAG: DUF4349 domain-containing protein [Defluviitaleaceae bacterium]|nr:DUF4349 domain-containing protein [Defluviitaleaceae bacterium]
MINKSWFRRLILLVFFIGTMTIVIGCGSRSYDDVLTEAAPEFAPVADDWLYDSTEHFAEDWRQDAPGDFADFDIASESEIGLYMEYTPHGLTAAADNNDTANALQPQADMEPAAGYSGETLPEGYQPQANETPQEAPMPQSPTPLGVDLMQRMIIRAASMTLNTLYYDDTASGIEQVVHNRGGFIENSRQWMEFCPYAGMLWRAEYVIRVPVGLFDTTNNDLMALAQVQYFSTTSQDATHEFNDLGSRLQIREAEEVRVQRMLDEATELVDIINLEARLTNLRLVIDAYRRRREEIDQLASFSTINLSVHEVVVLPEIEEDNEDEYYPVYAEYTFGGRIGGAFRASVNFTGQALELIGIFLAAIILPVGLLGAVLGAAYFAVKKFGTGNILKSPKAD